MSPSTIIFGLLAVGFSVLLVAPRIHRAVNARSRAEAETQRSKRVADMLASSEGVEIPVWSNAAAVKARDMLLLRGVRTELLSVIDGVVLVASRADITAVEAVLSELDEGPSAGP